MVIVDTSVWIDYLNNRLNSQTAWLENALGVEQLGLTSLILCEVLQGIRYERRFRETQQELVTLPVFEGLTTELAIVSARYFRTLQRRGITIRKTVDCLIASFCIEEGYQLLHIDHGFDAFENHLGLRVLHPPPVALI
jgi:predicted nucleic acid-binding protein